MVTRATSWLTNLGLQRRIQLLTIVSLLAIFAFFWVAGHLAIEKSRRQSLENQLAIANLVASSLDQRLSGALALLETTATQPDLHEPFRFPSPGQVKLLRDAQLQLRDQGHRLFWLDTVGNVIWVEPPDDASLVEPFSDFASVCLAMGNSAHYVSSTRQPLDLSASHILLAVPVRQAAGETSSLLVTETDIDHLGLEGVLDQAELSGSTYIEVVDQDGKVLASSLPALHTLPANSDLSELDRANQLAVLIDSQQATVEKCHQCHEADGEENIRRTEEVLAFAPLRVAPWGVVVRRPASEIMAPVGYLRRLIFMGGSAALTAGLLITWLITRQVVGPIQALNEASVQLASGNLGVSIPSDGIDEVGRLTANLEQMRARLEVTLEDHRRWNEALEEMVEERTRELAALYEQFQGKEAMVKRLLGKVLTTQEEERARLARELHDTIGQSLTAIIMTTTAVESSLPANFVSGKEKLASVRSIATQTLHDLRGLIFDLRPEVLDDLGLGLAIHSQVKKYLEPAGVKAQLRAAGLKDQLPAEVETAVFRVVQEAITNIARHAQATKATISLTKKDDRLIVRIEDNGVGFDPDQVMNQQQQVWGLRGMKERITLLDGKFYVGSRPGSGTLVLAEVPLDRH